MKSKLIIILLFVFFLTNTIGAKNFNGAGASFPKEVYLYWISKYNKSLESNGDKFNYQSIGSGGGIKQIKLRLINFGASDEALDSKELKENNLYQFPTVISAIAIVYNLEGIKDGELKLSNEVISEIFNGEIVKWNDPKVQNINKNLKLPNKKINIIHRSDSSGTTYNFTNWLSNISNKWKENIGTGKIVEWPTGIGAKGNEGIASLVKQSKNSIGYIEYSYKKGANLNAALIQDGTGSYVSINKDSIAMAAKNAIFSPSNDFKTSLIALNIKGAYPIANATYILLPKEKAESKDVKKFFSFSFEQGDSDAIELGFEPLDKNTKKLILDYLKL